MGLLLKMYLTDVILQFPKALEIKLEILFQTLIKILNLLQHLKICKMLAMLL